MIRRKTYLINRGFQLRFITKIFLVIFALIFILAVTILVINTQTLVDSERQAVDSARSALTKINEIQDPIFKLQLTRDNMKGNILKIFIITVVLSILVVSIVFLFITHRIVGPIYRFKKTLNSMKDGDMSVRVILREKDEMQDLADAFNGMAISLNTKLHEMQTAISEIKKENVKSDTLKKNIKKLDDTINQFKIAYH
ncbi:HAMP domain-containing protein [Spirochaetota bacterium]